MLQAYHWFRRRSCATRLRNADRPLRGVVKRAPLPAPRPRLALLALARVIQLRDQPCAAGIRPSGVRRRWSPMRRRRQSVACGRARTLPGVRPRALAASAIRVAQLDRAGEVLRTQSRLNAIQRGLDLRLVVRRRRCLRRGRQHAVLVGRPQPRGARLAVVRQETLLRVIQLALLHQSAGLRRRRAQRWRSWGGLGAVLGSLCACDFAQRGILHL